MATSRLAVGSVLGTVASVANAVGSVANTITTGVESINDWAVSARKQQQLRHVLNAVDFEHRTIEEMSQSIAERRIQIDEFCAKSQNHQVRFNEAKLQLEAALELHRNPTK